MPNKKTISNDTNRKSSMSSLYCSNTPSTLQWCGHSYN